MEGRWHQNCGYTSPILFLGTDKEISEKRNFFVNPSENFQCEHFSGRVLSEIPQTQVSQYLYKRGVQIFFDRILVAWSWLRAAKCDQLEKNKRCYKNRYGHNFQNIGSTMNERLFIGYEQTLIGCGLWKRYFDRILFLTQQFSFYFFLNSTLNTPTPLWHTYSEPSGHEDSPGTIQKIPYL